MSKILSNTHTYVNKNKACMSIFLKSSLFLSSLLPTCWIRWWLLALAWEPLNLREDILGINRTNSGVYDFSSGILLTLGIVAECIGTFGLYHMKLCLQYPGTQTYGDLGWLREVSITLIICLWHFWTGYPWDTGMSFEWKITSIKKAALGFLLIGGVGMKVTEWNMKITIELCSVVHILDLKSVELDQPQLLTSDHSGFLSVCKIIV